MLEGGHVTLSVTDIRIMTDYYVDRVDAFLITKMPLHGSIRIRNVPDDHRLTQFTLTQLIDKQIVYWHDGSENPLDVIEIVAVAGTVTSIFYHNKCKRFLLVFCISNTFSSFLEFLRSYHTKCSVFSIFFSINAARFPLRLYCTIFLFRFDCFLSVSGFENLLHASLIVRETDMDEWCHHNKILLDAQGSIDNQMGGRFVLDYTIRQF